MLHDSLDARSLRTATAFSASFRPLVPSLDRRPSRPAPYRGRASRIAGRLAEGSDLVFARHRPMHHGGQCRQSKSSSGVAARGGSGEDFSLSFPVSPPCQGGESGGSAVTEIAHTNHDRRSVALHCSLVRTDVHPRRCPGLSCFGLSGQKWVVQKQRQRGVGRSGPFTSVLSSADDPGPRISLTRGFVAKRSDWLSETSSISSNRRSSGPEPGGQRRTNPFPYSLEIKEYGRTYKTKSARIRTGDGGQKAAD